MNTSSPADGGDQQWSVSLTTLDDDAGPTTVIPTQLGKVKKKNRFANAVADNNDKRKQLQPTRKKAGSIKFSANNFVTQCYESFGDYFEIVELLGEGAYGEVFVCRHRESGAERAVKILEVSTEEDAETVLSEFNILRGIDHPNLLKIYNLFIQQDQEQDKSTFYIVSDLYEGGELFTELEDYGHFVEGDVALIMTSVLSCINYCHSQNLFHRDLKPENILLADDQMNLDDIKIIDFGLAEYFEDYHTDRFSERVGSSYYIAPEILAGDYGPKCDLWSCGVVAFILLSGEAPFDGDSDDEIIDSVRAGSFSFDENPNWENVSEEAKEFVEWLLKYDENERPTAEEALQHPWLINTRNTSRQGLQEKDSKDAANVLTNLETFSASSKLKQAVCAFTASQLIRKHEKDVIDELFRAMDTTCNGKLSQEELKVGYADYMGKAMAEEEVNAIFQRVNYSCSGAIEYSEFVVASIQLDEIRLRATFNEFHKRGCDALDAEDLKKALDFAGHDNMNDYVVNTIMKQIDTDHDGLISFEEFKSAMMDDSAIATEADGSGGHLRQPCVSSTRRRPSMKPTNLKRVRTIRMDGGAIYKPSDLRKCQSLGMDELLLSLQRTISKQKNAIRTVKSFAPHATSVSYARRPRCQLEVYDHP